MEPELNECEIDFGALYLAECAARPEEKTFGYRLNHPIELVERPLSPEEEQHASNSLFEFMA